MMTRRSLVTSALAGSALGRAAGAKNILFLVADDLGLHTGAYGDGNARTPNLDRLASEGVRFTNGYCTTASCSASRSVLFTGMHNHANGQYGHAHAEHHFALLPKVRPVASLLKDAGYRTGLIGKFHVAPPSAFQWDLLAEGQDRNVQGMAERAADFFRSAGDRPWYLHMGYGDPHRAGSGFANERAWPGVRPEVFDPAKLKLPSFLPDNAAVRKEVAQYYQAANRLDQGIGMVLAALKAAGQYDQTLIVFLSDNGMPFPNAKTNLYDGGARLPLLVRSPAQSRRGLVNHGMISWVDLAPTLLDWAGAKGPEYPLHGRSLLPVLEQENPAGWDKVFLSHTFHEVTMYYPMRGIRTTKYKYIRNLFPEVDFPHASDLYASSTWQSVLQDGTRGKVGKRPAEAYLHRAPEELYDISADPDEVRNLAREAASQGILSQLRKEVEGFRKRTADPWTINDGYRPLQEQKR